MKSHYFDKVVVVLSGPMCEIFAVEMEWRPETADN